MRKGAGLVLSTQNHFFSTTTVWDDCVWDTDNLGDINNNKAFVDARQQSSSARRPCTIVTIISPDNIGSQHELPSVRSDSFAEHTYLVFNPESRSAFTHISKAM